MSEILIVCLLTFEKYIQKAILKNPAFIDSSVMCQKRALSDSELFSEIMRLC